jgi:hypothetical protein
MLLPRVVLAPTVRRVLPVVEEEVAVEERFLVITVEDDVDDEDRPVVATAVAAVDGVDAVTAAAAAPLVRLGVLGASAASTVHCVLAEVVDGLDARVSCLLVVS